MEYSWPVVSMKRSRLTIGFLDENLDNEFRSQMMPGIIEAARKYNVNVIRFAYYSLHSAYSYTSQVQTVLNLIDQYKLQGLMFLGWGRAGALQNPDFVTRYQSIPILSIGTRFDTIPNVYCPGEVHIREILEHLANHHHITRIAYISPIIPDNRNDVYLNFMREYGIYDPELYIGPEEIGELTMPERARLALNILIKERRVNVRAIVSLYSEEAVAITEELCKQGIHVPNDIAVTGYEDRDIGKYCSPPLTTVYFPWLELGFYGCEKMVELLTTGHTSFSKVIPGKVIYRYSCGCLSKSVKIAGAVSYPKIAKTPAEITADVQQTIITELEAALPNTGLDLQRILDAFFNNFQNKTTNTFLMELALQFQKIEYNCRLTGIEDLISVFRRVVFPYLAGHKDVLLWSGDLFQQAQVLIWEKVNNISNQEKVHAKILNQGLQEISQILITNFSLENLLDSLAKSLHKLNIPGCYIFKFNCQVQDNDEPELFNVKNPFSGCTLVFQYRDHKRLNIQTNQPGQLKMLFEKLFASEERAYSVLGHLIHIANKIIGFVLFEPGPMDNRIYQALTAHISIAFQGSMLLEQLESSYQELAQQAHREGMADISSEILHNTGNILNSVNASVHFMVDLIDNSAIQDLIKANRILENNLDDIGNFIVHDPKGKKLFQFYIGLGNSFIELQNQLLHYINRLDNKVRSINEIIAAQQSYAGISEIAEELDIASVVDDVIKLFSESLDNCRIQIIRDYQGKPKVMAQRMKLFPILANIISNAQEAMFDNPEFNRRLIFSVTEDSQGKYIRITDNGHGIPADTLKKIFENEFAIKKEHHAFGLYRSANLMAEMGGDLWAESPGPGKGATIVIQFKN
jgi:DNA-binding LacI/PurR family transcriptional regulator/signal transduction histidine kinase